MKSQKKKSVSLVKIWGVMGFSYAVIFLALGCATEPNKYHAKNKKIISLKEKSNR